MESKAVPKINMIDDTQVDPAMEGGDEEAAPEVTPEAAPTETADEEAAA